MCVSMLVLLLPFLDSYGLGKIGVSVLVLLWTFLHSYRPGGVNMSVFVLCLGSLERFCPGHMEALCLWLQLSMYVHVCLFPLCETLRDFEFK